MSTPSRALDTVDGLFVGPADLSMTRGRGPFKATAKDLADFAKVASVSGGLPQDPGPSPRRAPRSSLSPAGMAPHWSPSATTSAPSGSASPRASPWPRRASDGVAECRRAGEIPRRAGGLGDGRGDRHRPCDRRGARAGRCRYRHRLAAGLRVHRHGGLFHAARCCGDGSRQGGDRGHRRALLSLCLRSALGPIGR